MGYQINQSSMCNSRNKVCIGTESNKWTRKNTKQLPFEIKAIEGLQFSDDHFERETMQTMPTC